MAKKKGKFYKKAGKKYYAVKVGRLNDVIVDTWIECKNLVDGYSGAKFKSFTDINLAKNWIEALDRI